MFSPCTLCPLIAPLRPFPLILCTSQLHIRFPTAPYHKLPHIVHFNIFQPYLQLQITYFSLIYLPNILTFTTTSHTHIINDSIICYMLQPGITPYLVQDINMYTSLTNVSTLHTHEFYSRGTATFPLSGCHTVQNIQVLSYCQFTSSKTIPIVHSLHLLHLQT